MHFFNKILKEIMFIHRTASKRYEIHYNCTNKIFEK